MYYAYETHPDLGSTNYLGLSMAFNFNPAQIRIESVETRPLYASLYKSYAHDPFAVAVVRNLQDEPISARLQVFVDGYYVGVVDEFDGVFQRLRLEAGGHRVEIRLDGYSALTFDVLIPPGETVTFRGELLPIQ